MFNKIYRLMGSNPSALVSGTTALSTVLQLPPNQPNLFDNRSKDTYHQVALALDQMKPFELSFHFISTLFTHDVNIELELEVSNWKVKQDILYR